MSKSFFAELRRRNVIRMAGLYIVGAWLVVQVAETVLPAFDIPNWVLRATIILLAIGFIPALVFSWVFELTSEGLKRESEVDRAQGIVDHTARKLDVAVIVLLLGIGGLMIWRPGSDPLSVAPSPGNASPVETKAAGSSAASEEDSAAASTASQASIAVLPFLNMSPDADNAFFADGISEELLNVLARVDGLKVASRTSAFTFKGKDTPIPEIARLLGVRHVLEGSVRKQGQRVRITAQLIQADSDGHLWSQTYDRELTDIFTIQQEIAEAIAGELGGLLGTRRMVVDAPTTDMAAYERFLRGRARFHQRNELPEAATDLEFAVQRDPAFAEAWVYLAATQIVGTGYTNEFNESESRQAAQVAVSRAAALNPAHPMVLAVQASLAFGEARLVESFALFERAAASSAQDSTPHMWLGNSLLGAGYVDEAVQALERAVLMDPLVGVNNGYLAIAYLSAGRSEEATASARAAIANGWGVVGNVLLTDALAAGRREEALAMIRSATSPSNQSSPTFTAFVSAVHDPATADAYLALRNPGGIPEDLMALGLNEQVFDWFDEQRRQNYPISRSGWMLRSFWLPSTRALREHPRFLDIARGFGLTELWAQRGYPPGCRLVNSSVGDHLDCSESRK